MGQGFSHLDEKGNLKMVDISEKKDTFRVAVAKGEVVFPEEVYEKVVKGDVPKGNFLTCAQVAGIMAAKRTWELIPLCHPLPITKIDLSFKFLPEKKAIEIRSEVKTTAKTGVEMEALVAVSVAALTIYDMCKALHKGIKITNIRLVYKEGGKSGKVVLEEEAPNG